MTTTERDRLLSEGDRLYAATSAGEWVSNAFGVSSRNTYVDAHVKEPWAPLFTTEGRTQGLEPEFNEDDDDPFYIDRRGVNNLEFVCWLHNNWPALSSALREAGERDDGEPITEEWLEELGPDVVGGAEYHYEDRNCTLIVDWCIEFGQWRAAIKSAIGDDLVVLMRGLPNRKSLRRLMSALGIKEQSNGN